MCSFGSWGEDLQGDPSERDASFTVLLSIGVRCDLSTWGVLLSMKGYALGMRFVSAGMDGTGVGLGATGSPSLFFVRSFKYGLVSVHFLSLLGGCWDDVMSK